MALNQSNRVEPMKTSHDESPPYSAPPIGVTQENGTPYQYPVYYQPYQPYPPAYNSSTTTTQQQQTIVYATNQPAPVIVQQPRRQSFAGPIILSCLVFWCCGCLFGLIAFIIAVVGRESASHGEADTARKLSRASYVVSIVGIIVGIVVIIIVLAVVLPQCLNPYCPNYGWKYDYYSSCKLCCTQWDRNCFFW